MESAAQALNAEGTFDREALTRRALRGASRGASSHFVGTSIVILSSFAVSTLAMNSGKKILDSRQKPSRN